MKKLVLSLFVLAMGLGINAQHALADEHECVHNNMAVWFEIPVTDMVRAVTFYNSIFAIELEQMNSENVAMALFPHNDCGVTGALIQMAEVQPGMQGPIVYLNGGSDLTTVLDRVEPNGGKVLVPKTVIPDVGFFAIFADTEGNRLGLFSPN